MTCFENSDAEDMENFAVILAAGKRLAARVKALEWQPIETAPKDGSYIWLGSSSSVRVGFWRNGADYANHNSVGGGWIDICAAEQARGPNGLHFEPTHWMPTPQPPRTETAQQRPTSTETDVNEQGTEGDSGTNKAG